MIAPNLIKQKYRNSTSVVAYFSYQRTGETCKFMVQVDSATWGTCTSLWTMTPNNSRLLKTAKMPQSLYYENQQLVQDCKYSVELSFVKYMLQTKLCIIIFMQIYYKQCVLCNKNMYVKIMKTMILLVRSEVPPGTC